MGQQQLLLLILGIVIAALAVVAGLQAFSENRRESAKDELVTTGTRIASEGIAWALGAELLGYGGGDPDGLTFEKMGYDEQTDGSYRTGDVVFTVDATEERFILYGEVAQEGSYSVTAVYGPREDCVLTDSQHNTQPATPDAPESCTW